MEASTGCTITHSKDNVSLEKSFAIRFTAKLASISIVER
jgi:hypothetical protein